jgi:hypothetical protein
MATMGARLCSSVDDTVEETQSLPKRTHSNAAATTTTQACTAATDAASTFSLLPSVPPPSPATAPATAAAAAVPTPSTQLTKGGEVVSGSSSAAANSSFGAVAANGHASSYVAADAINCSQQTSVSSAAQSVSGKEADRAQTDNATLSTAQRQMA